MNRENKRKLYDKHYYKTHPCDEAFTCKHCGRLVVPEGAGSDHRNHCPYCLCSVHLDNAPGDREADCGALMEPIGVWVRKNGEWALLHRCRMCGTIHANRVAADDNPLLLMSLASKPLACPPFPLDKLEELAALSGVSMEGYTYPHHKHNPPTCQRKSGDFLCCYRGLFRFFHRAGVLVHQHGQILLAAA